MKLKVLRTDRLFNGAYAHLVATCDTSDDREWYGYFMILATSIEIGNPITEITLSSKSIRKDLSEFKSADLFLDEVMNQAKISYEVALHNSDKELYIALLRTEKGLSFVTEEDEEAFYRLALYASKDHLDTIEKFGRVALLDDQNKKLNQFIKLRHGLRIEPV